MMQGEDQNLVGCKWSLPQERDMGHDNGNNAIGEQGVKPGSVALSPANAS